MRIVYTIPILLVLFLAQGCCISTSTVVVEKPRYFPIVSGSDLHGEVQTFPECLSKDRTILVVAFQRWQQTLCDGWYAKIEKFIEENQGTAYYEVPTIAEMNAFSRWFIYQGMRGGIKDSTMRSQVVTLHINKEPFKEALEIKTEETVHVFVVDKEGKILGKEMGEWSEEKWGKIIKAVKD